MINTELRSKIKFQCTSFLNSFGIIPSKHSFSDISSMNATWYNKRSYHIAYLIFFFFFSLLLTFFSRNIPFFWDSINLSWNAHFFYETKFSGFILPAETDTGNIPFYGFYLSLIWKLFGRTLLISHLAFLPFLFGFYSGIYQLARKFLVKKNILWAVLITMLNPVIITQQILMAYDIVLACMFLWAINMLLEQKKVLYSLFLVLLIMISVRGLYLVIALFFIDVVLNYSLFRKKLFKNIIPYFAFALVLLIWLTYHKIQTGWFLISPLMENYDRDFLGLSMFIKQLGYIVWKLADFGIIALWLTAIAGLIILVKKKSISPGVSKLIRILSVLTVILSLGMAIISTPASHRYFISVFSVLSILVVAIIELFKKPLLKYLLMMIFVVVLISGNIWLYPLRYGNGWDCSLKVLPYFSLEQKMQNYIITEKINPAEVATYFPLYAGTYYSWLAEKDFAYSDIENTGLQQSKYVLYSNISNKFKQETTSTIQTKWVKLYEVKSGQVFIRLYQNPNLKSIH